MKRQVNLIIDIDSRKVTKYNDLIKVGDSVNLQLTLLSKGKQLSITQETLQLFLKKEDNKKVQQSININGNVINCILDAQATTTVGKVIGEIIFTATGNKVTSSSFLFEVEGSINNEILEVSKDKVDVLLDIENSISKANNTVEKYKSNIEPIAGTSESIAALAAIKKTSEESKNSLDTSITTSKIAKKDLDESNVQAKKNLDALGKLGDATNLAKDVETLKEQVLENTFTKIETDSSLTKLESCKDSFVRNMQIKGRTLQNEFTRPSSMPMNPAVTLNGTEYTTSTNAPLYIKEVTLKGNTQYTCIFLAKGNSTGVSSNGQFFRVDDSSQTINNGFVGNIDTNYSIKMFKFTTLNDGISTFLLRNAVSGITQMWVKDIIVLEGDYTNKEIPPYFEGIKSVGEAEGNKISILTKGKNLVETDFSKWTINSSEPNNVIIDNNSMQLKGTIGKNSVVSIPVTINKENIYIASFEAKGNNVVLASSNYFVGLSLQFFYKEKYLYEIDYANKDFVGTYDWKKLSLKVIPKDNVIFDKCLFQFYGRNYSGEYFVKNIQLEEGTTATPYENYKEDKTEILIGNEPLRGIPNGVSDVVDLDKSERTKNVGKAIFNGSEGNWSIINNTKSNTILFRISVPDLFIIANNYTLLNCICNKFALMTATDGWLSDTTEGICQDPTDRTLRFNVFKSRLETPDVAGLKKLLKSWSDAGTPLEIYYPLANPITEKLNIKDTLQAFENGYIQLDNAITPTAQLEYSTNLPSIISRVVENQDRLIDRISALEELVLTQTANKILENGGK